MRTLKRFLPGLLIAGIAFGAWAGVAGRAVAAAPAVLTPLPPTEQQAGKPVALAAKLTDASGRALGGQRVLFLVHTDIFGDRLMQLSYGVTDATGRAAISYKPSWEGDTRIVARFAGNADYAAAETNYSFNAVGPVAVHENAKFGLEPIRAWAPVAVFALVATVWGILAYVVVHTVRGLRAQQPAIEVAGRRLAPASSAGNQGTQE